MELRKAAGEEGGGGAGGLSIFQKRQLRLEMAGSCSLVPFVLRILT